MAKTDLFSALDALFTKSTIESSPGTYILHRFLASDADFAVAARYLQKDIREDALILRTWQGLLPRARGAPRLQYVGPKKQPAEEALVATLMHRHAWRREVAEEAVTLTKLTGRALALYYEYGVEPPEEET